MPTHAELSARLLKEAATFFRQMASQNEPIREQMNGNAAIFEQVADLLLQNPLGVVGGRTYAAMGAKLLRDAGAFFRTLASQNEPIREQMTQSAAMCDRLADMLEKNPAGTLG